MVSELSQRTSSPDDIQTTYRKSSELFNAVSETDPGQEFGRHGFRTREAVLGQVAVEYDDYYKNLVRYGYDDLRSALELPMASIDRDLESQLEFVRHEKTIQALGLLANRSEEPMHGIVHNYGANYGARLAVETDAAQKPYLRLLGAEAPPKDATGRCPFAAMQQGVMPAKPFENFTGWAGEVIARAEHKERQARRARWQ